jgi:hypothetical protein
VRSSSLATSAITWPIIPAQDIDRDEDGAVCGMRIGRGNRSTRLVALLVLCFPRRQLGFHASSEHVEFVVHEAALGRFIFQVPRVLLLILILPIAPYSGAGTIGPVVPGVPSRLSHPAFRI